MAKVDEAWLEVSALSAGYGNTVVLDGLNLSVARGEAVSIVGRNGVGKSSFLATLMGHTTLHGGTIKLGGQDLTHMKPFRRARAGLGYVPQEREVFPSLTVVVKVPGVLTGCSSCSRALPNGGATGPSICRAVNSKCWPLDGR